MQGLRSLLEVLAHLGIILANEGNENTYLSAPLKRKISFSIAEQDTRLLETKIAKEFMLVCKING